MNSILIADDSIVIRNLLEKIFTNMFFDTYVAENGSQAIELFKKYKPNVVILDHDLPIIDGTDVLYTIRSMKDIKQPKIIFCSSITSVEAIRKLIEIGCDDYIMKPFDEEIITSKLKILELI